MKTHTWKLGAAPLAVSLTCGMAANAPAQTKKPVPAKAAGAKKMGGKGDGALKRAQAMAGKPLTEAQQKTVREAAAARQKTIKAAQEPETPVAADASSARMLAGLRPEHPRLLATQADFAELQKLVAQKPEAARWFSAIRQTADAMLVAPVSEYVIPDGRRLLTTSRRVKACALTLGLVFRLTGDKRYAERLWRELDAAAAFPDWNPSHFLDTAEMTAGFAIGLDWLHSFWTPEQRGRLRGAILEKGLGAALPLYREQRGFPQRINNWNLVCNGGMILGALALAEDEPALAGEIVAGAVASLPRAMRHFAPDGAWGEGPGYWDYATEYNVFALAALRSALGTDFDLAQIPGIARAANFPSYFTGPTGRTFNFADSDEKMRTTPQLFWLATAFDLPHAAAFQWPAATQSPGPLDLLWGAPWLAQPPVTPALPLDAHFGGVEIVALRSTWDDPRATFAGFKGGDNSIDHGNLDLGTFVLDALGQRWALDLGKGRAEYDLPGYFGAARWDYYRCRAEGQNCFVLDPGPQADQDPKAVAKITRFVSRPERAFAIADLSAAYAGQASSAARGLALVDRRQVLVQDEIVARAPAQYWWFMHTQAAIELSDDAATATLTQGGERFFVRLLEPAGARFSVQPAEPFAVSPNPPGQISRAGIRKLAIHLPDIRRTRVAVWFTPALDAPVPRVQPLAEWQ